VASRQFHRTCDDKWPNTSDWTATGGVSNQQTMPAEQLSLVLLNFRAMNKDQENSETPDQGAMLWVGIAD